MLSPIVLFTYNRLIHTKRTVEALAKNFLAKESKLFIFSDGVKNKSDKENVSEIREYLKTIKGFKNITIIEQPNNKGLANSISSGVTDIVNKFGKAIVVEDDIVTSPYFLTFMNDALNYYENNKEVWHISGWNYPMDNTGLDDTFMWRMVNCWGWATWKDRWVHYKKDPDYLVKTYSDYDIYKFNIDNAENRWKYEVLENKIGRLDTWAVFWYATIFNKNGLCVHPTQTFVENIGMDGTGINNGSRYDTFSSELCNRKIALTDDLYENDLALYRIKEFFHRQRNANLIFNVNINTLINKTKDLIKTDKKYILYGAGVFGQLLLKSIPDYIAYIIDMDEKKHYTKMEDKIIFPLAQVTSDNYQIIISALGREKEIEKSLIMNFNIPKKRIISFKFIQQFSD